MRTIISAEISRMRSETESSFADSCQILTYGESFDAYHSPVAGYTTGSAIDCSYDPRSSSERFTPEHIQIVFDATIRVALGTVVGEKDKVRIVQRFSGDTTDYSSGTANSLLDYGIAGTPLQRPSHLLVPLLEVK